MADNEYEIERLRVIAENQKLLESLGLDHFATNSPGGSSRASPSAAPSSSRTGSKRRRDPTGGTDVGDDAIKAATRRKIKAEREAAEPRQSTRQSTRLMGLKVDDDEAMKKHSDEMERQAELRRESEKVDRKVRYQTMTLAEMCDDPPKTSLPGRMGSLIPRLQKIASEAYARSVPPIDPYTDDPSPSTTRDADAALRQSFSKTRLIATARVCPERVYSMVVHPDPSKTLAFVGDKRGTLAFWDALDEGEEELEDISGSERKGGKRSKIGNGVKQEEEAAPEVKLEDEDDEDDVLQEVEEEKPQVSVGGLGLGKIWRIQAHAKNSLSCLKLDPVDATRLYTSSYDNTLRELSLKDAKSIEILAVPDENCLLTSFDLTPDGREMWVTDSQGGITHVDMREGGKEGWARRRWVTGFQRSSMKIGGVAVNPVSPWILSTASNDRTMKIWDTRQLGKIKCEPTEEFDTPEWGLSKRSSPEYYDTFPKGQCEHVDFAKAVGSKARAGVIRGVAAHGQSCSSTYWDPWGRRVLTTSYDDKIRVFEFDPTTMTNGPPSAVTEYKPKHAVRHDCQCGRWVSILKAVWSPNTEHGPHFSVGNMKKRINVYSGLTGAVIADLSSPHVTAVPAVTCSHPSIVNTVLGGNNSGKVQLWAEPVA